MKNWASYGILYSTGFFHKGPGQALQIHRKEGTLIHRIQYFLVKYKEQLSYLFFGVLTTIVNYGVFWLFHQAWQGRHVLFANLLTFLLATAFAYITNKVFVFRSPSWRPSFLAREALAFLVGRLFSFAVEELGLYIAAYVLHLGRYALWGVDGTMLSKVALSFLAVLLNYFFSKFLVFAKKDGGAKAE